MSRLFQQPGDSSRHIQFFVACPYGPLSYSTTLTPSSSSFPVTFFLSSSLFPPPFLLLFSLFHAPSHTCSHITFIFFRASEFFLFSFSVSHIILRLRHRRDGCTVLINCYYVGVVIKLRGLFEMLSLYTFRGGTRVP